MGREAECECECNGARSRVKALVEPPDLILRGQLRRRLPISQLVQVRAEGAFLRFRSGNDTFSLDIGVALAPKWASALTSSPPGLAKKLGITPETVVRMIGEVDDGALDAALATAKALADKSANLIEARVPIWLIYPKGRGHALTENDVRTTALAAGIVDTKVCAVSSTLTALRFV